MYEPKLWQDHVTEFEDRYTGMPIMTLRQIMIKTMVRTTLLMMLSPIL